MKKITALFAVLVMGAIGMSACGGNSATNAVANTNKTVANAMSAANNAMSQANNAINQAQSAINAASNAIRVSSNAVNITTNKPANAAAAPPYTANVKK